MEPIRLRKFPYPYEAALSICSDIDDTDTAEKFLLIQEFLNTRRQTRLGKGLGLEIGNSFFVYSDSGLFSFLSSTTEDRRTITEFITAGLVDCMHSYGERRAFKKSDAVNALEMLRRDGCFVTVWIDHRKEISNLGTHRTKGRGDEPNSEYYHTPHTLGYGIKFAWLGACTPVIGQSTGKVPNFLSSFNACYPVKTTRLLFKEVAKWLLGKLGYQKCRIYSNNDLVSIRTLNRDQKVYEFKRFSNSPEGLGKEADFKGLYRALDNKCLKKLLKSQGYMIIYTHLGKFREDEIESYSKTTEALQNLASEYRKGRIFVTTTSRLLKYYIVHKYLDWDYEIIDGEGKIHILRILDPVTGPYVPSTSDLEGITFYTPALKRTRIFVENREITATQYNPPDSTGNMSVTIPWTRLSYPEGF